MEVHDWQKADCLYRRRDPVVSAGTVEWTEWGGRAGWQRASKFLWRRRSGLAAGGAGAGEEMDPITITLEELEYTTEEAEALFQRILEELPGQIAGDNPSLGEVRKDLNLITSVPGAEGVRLPWTSENPELMNSFGEIETDQIRHPERR